MSVRSRITTTFAALAIVVAACKDTPKAAPTEPEPTPPAATVADSAPVTLETPGTAAAVIAPASSTCLGYERRHAALKDATGRLPADSPDAERGRARLAALAAMMTDACN